MRSSARKTRSGGCGNTATIRFFHIADAPTRSSGMTFTDKNSIDKETKLCDRAIDCLRDLADRHYEAAEKAELIAIKNKLTSVFIRLKDTEPRRSHSFTLKKDGDHWYFSFECSFGEDSLPVKSENIRLSDVETDDVIRIIAKYDLISKANGYAEPPEGYQQYYRPECICHGIQPCRRERDKLIPPRAG